MLEAQTTGFDNRPPIMSHTFPEQALTAAVVGVQISMTDLAYDVVLLWRSDQLVSLIATARLSAPAAVTSFPQSHTPDVAAPQKGTEFEVFHQTQ